MDLVEYIEMNEGPDIWDYLIGVWHVMTRSVEEGLSRTGELPAAWHIQRKAKYMFEHIVETSTRSWWSARRSAPMPTLSASRTPTTAPFVTAPTCGACGVLPAVLYYFEDKRNLVRPGHCPCFGRGGPVR